MSEEIMDRHKDEGALRIMEALSAVDEELLERSGMPVAEDMGEKRSGKKVTYMSSYKKGSRKLWRHGRIAAACLAIVAVGAVSWGGLRLTRMITAEDNGTSGGFSGAALAGTANNEETTPEMTAGGGMYGDMGVTNNGHDSADPGSETSTDGANGGGGGASGQEGNPASAEEGMTCSTPCPTDDLQSITEGQARDLALGAYLPRRLPAGYSFESAHRDDKGQLYLCWTLGMNAIRLSVTYVEEGEVEAVDISRPETYDVRLYELPYGETVPQEYWAFFDNPVFLAEDFSFEAVASRMKSSQDTGDTDMPNGRFCVLYPDGILVGFDGDGQAEDIWTMLASPQE